MHMQAVLKMHRWGISQIGLQLLCGDGVQATFQILPASHIDEADLINRINRINNSIRHGTVARQLEVFSLWLHLMGIHPRPTLGSTSMYCSGRDRRAAPGFVVATATGREVAFELRNETTGFYLGVEMVDEWWEDRHAAADDSTGYFCITGIMNEVQRVSVRRWREIWGKGMIRGRGLPTSRE